MADARQERQTPRRVRRYGPLLIWMAVIFYASTGEFSAANTSSILGPFLHWLFPAISEDQIALAHFIIRKAAHFSEYAILGWLAASAFATSSRQTIRRGWFLTSLTFVALYALSDEYHQSFVSSRTGSIYDSLIDMSGGLTAIIVYLFWNKRRRNGKTRNER